MRISKLDSDVHKKMSAGESVVNTRESSCESELSSETALC
jgi:hypothetical protein